MNCTEAKLRLEPLVNGTLEDEEKRALEEHLSLCEGCRLELELRQAIQSTPSLAPQLDFGDQPADAAGIPAVVGSASPPSESAAPDAVEVAGKAATSDAASGDESATPLESPIMSGSAMTQDEGEISFADLSLDMPTLVTDSAQTTASSPPPPPPPPPAPAKTSRADNAPASASNSWEFEPIDVPHDSAPPEGSLTFAHQALERKREHELKGKNAMVRAVLWGAGALAGLALLGVSIWVALAVRQEAQGPAPAVSASAEESALEAGSVQSDSTGMAQVGAGDDAGVAPAPAATAGGEADAAPPSPGSQNSPASPAPPVTSHNSGSPPTAPDSPAPRAIQAGGLSAGSMAPLPIAPKAAAPKASTSTSKRAASAASKPAPTGTISRKASSPVPEQHSGVASSSPSDTRATAPTATHDAPPGEHGSSNAHTAPPPDVRSEPIWSVDETPGEKTPSPPSPAPAARTTPRVAAPETSSTAPPAVPAPAAPAVPRPIERLHLATQTAAAAGDLPSLRKLKSTWKNFIRSGAGQDRARAKREFADCLWAIQEITTRQADQRDALAAYREYVLSAPAGGTDARTVARMRYLEDVLTDIK